MEVGTEQFQAQATVATEPEHTKPFEQMVVVNPALPRIIPVITLTRKS